tara:strand:+ start:42 stop:323 length:282 start_codon:yes stop_codon:yes gene_type:complete
MRITFEGHQGVLWPEDNCVVFYGVLFKNISIAITKVLRHVKPSDNYGPWCFGNYRGVKDGLTGKIYIEGRWFDDDKQTSLYLKHVAESRVYKK